MNQAPSRIKKATMVEEFEEPKTEFQEKLRRRGIGPFRQGDELAKGSKNSPFFPFFPCRRSGH